MPSASPKSDRIRLTRHPQISESHCGPAVLQILLQHCGFEISQEDIVKAAGIQKTLDLQGSRIDQLAQAVETLNPDLSLYYKEHSDLTDIEELINKHHTPAGVEWQGLFEDDVVDNEDLDQGDTDYGHYSIITTVDTIKNELIILDPYKDFVDQDRIFSFDNFLYRWWDTNEVVDNEDNAYYVVDERLLFITALKNDIPPISGLRPGLDYPLKIL